MGPQIIFFSLVNLVAAVMCDGMRGQQNVTRQEATIEQSKMTGFVSSYSSSPLFLKTSLLLLLSLLLDEYHELLVLFTIIPKHACSNRLQGLLR